MNAYERFKRQIDDLVVRYVDDDIDDRALMQQLRHLGPHLRQTGGIVGKTQPSSRPPGNLAARQLHDRILDEALMWAWTLGGTRIRQDRCLQTLPILVAQRLDAGDPDKTKILHGQHGLYANAGQWHLRARIFLGYDRPADRYPSAECPHCHYRDSRGGSIRARGDLAFCANRECRDEQGRRREWNRIVLDQFVRDALRQGV